MNFEAILSDLKAKKYQPVYFLMGEESYYIDYISNFIIDEVLNDTEKEFNQTVLYAKDIDCLLYTSPSPRDRLLSRMPSSA